MKAPGGMSKVLFVRATPELLEALDRLAEEERRAQPGQSTSRSDVARKLLYAALRRKHTG